MKLLPLRHRIDEQACCACGVVKNKRDFPAYSLDPRKKSARCEACWSLLMPAQPKPRRSARV